MLAVVAMVPGTVLAIARATADRTFHARMATAMTTMMATTPFVVMRDSLAIRARAVPAQCPHSARTVPAQCPHSARMENIGIN